MSNERIEPTFKPQEVDERLLESEPAPYYDAKFQYSSPGHELYKNKKTAKDRDYPVADVSDADSSWYAFSGRLDRVRALILFLGSTFFALAFIVFADRPAHWIAGFFGTAASPGDFQMNPLYYVYAGLTFWLLSLIFIAQKRLRDINYHPGYTTLLFIPPVNLFLIYLLVVPGSTGANHYGAQTRRPSWRTWTGVVIVFLLVPILLVTFKVDMNFIFEHALPQVKK